MEQQSYMNLPTRIIEGEILLWLPVKSLLRFKCVCKRWLSLIESRSFIDSHYSRERDDDRVVLHQEPCPFRRDARSLVEVDPNQRFPQSEDIVELMGPQLGLFCQVAGNGDITLFNPATKMLKRFHPLGWQNNYFFQPFGYGYVCGFGLDPLTRDYKIVIFCLSNTAVCIYNSTIDSWKVTQVSQLDSIRGAANYSRSKTFVNEVYYWLVEPLSKDCVILAFDMMSERFREIQIPRDFIRKRIFQICARDDSLTLLAFDNKQVDLWVMGEEGFWTRSCRVGPFVARFHPYYVQYYVWTNMLVLISSDVNQLTLVDVFTHKQRKIAFPPHIFTYSRSSTSARSVFLYKESLVSIEGAHTYGD